MRCCTKFSVAKEACAFLGYWLRYQSGCEQVIYLRVVIGGVFVQKAGICHPRMPCAWICAMG